MKLVQKGNRQLRIQDDRLDAMLAAGFSEVDPETGKLLKKDLVDETKKLKKENSELKKENAQLKEQLQAATEKAQ